MYALCGDYKQDRIHAAVPAPEDLTRARWLARSPFSGGSRAVCGRPAAAMLLGLRSLWHYRGAALARLRRQGAGCSTAAAQRRGRPRPRAHRRPARRCGGPCSRCGGRSRSPSTSSRSMGLRGGLERSRLERVRDFLRGRGLPAGSPRGIVPGYFSFSESLSPLAREGIGGELPDGPRTDLAARGGRGARRRVLPRRSSSSPTGGTAPPGAGRRSRALPDVPAGASSASAPASAPSTPEIVSRSSRRRSPSPASRCRSGCVVRATGFAGRERPAAAQARRAGARLAHGRAARRTARSCA